MMIILLHLRFELVNIHRLDLTIACSTRGAGRIAFNGN